MLQNRVSLSATNIIVVITILAFLVQNILQNGDLIFGLNAYFLKEDFWWQPLSTMFAHAGMMHLVMNMFILFQFGNMVEHFRGAKEFLLLYFIAGILTSLLSFGYIYLFEAHVNLVGASGAICAVLGYVAYYDKFQRNGIFVWVALISFAPLLLGMPIAWYAHLIGLGVGFLYALIRK